MIKAIDTYHNGNYFRSRLEARWAVFFENMGWDYQYEPEGYDLDNGERYLPDFYLPKFDVFVEVKPELNAQTELNIVYTIRRAAQLIIHKRAGLNFCFGNPTNGMRNLPFHLIEDFVVDEVPQTILIDWIVKWIINEKSLIKFPLTSVGYRAAVEACKTRFEYLKNHA